MTYTVSLRHYSFARSPEYTANTVQEAMRIGDTEFDGGFSDHEIVVFDQEGYIVAFRRMTGPWNLY